MDDYPRAPILTDQEAHLDLHMWMIVSTSTLSRVATVLDAGSVDPEKAADAAHYKELADSLKTVLRDNFWDESRQMYDDFYIDKDGKKQFDGHTGYLNFFPLFLGGIDPSDDRFETVFQMLISNSTGLWTDYGLRSLSKNDPYYQMGQNYWTSPIWMNINFLIVSALHSFSSADSVGDNLKTDIKEAYQKLRMNLVDMVVNSYASTGYIWEVYNDDTGAGMDNHPFTGWSALVTNLMAEIY